MTLVCPDVSEFQKPLDDTYPGDFIIMRATFGAYYLDKHFLANTAAAAKLYAAGRLKGVILYHVYTKDPVAEQYKAFWSAVGPKRPDWLAGVMIDVETWPRTTYALSGNHSARVNQLAGMHAQKLGSWDSVLVYGNRGDLDLLAPQRDKRMRAVVAAYTNSWDYKRARGAIGQQYTDGQWKFPIPKGMRRATAPFGLCDHNAFPDVKDGAAMMRLLRGKPAPAAPPPPPAPPHYDPAGHPHGLVDPKGAYLLYVNSDGTVELRHNGSSVGKAVFK